MRGQRIERKGTEEERKKGKEERMGEEGWGG